MKILNFGSINIDYVYSVNHIVKPGETIKGTGRNVFCGGKGLNQSIALANAKADVYHAGLIGEDGGMLLQALCNAGVHTDLIQKVKGSSSHTFIQVDSYGQNSILFYAGDNLIIKEDFISEVIQKFEPGDYLLLQNEIGSVPQIMEKAWEKGMKIIFNPSPIHESVKKYPLERVHIFMLNEIEGSILTGFTSPDAIIDSMMDAFPNARTILTLGKDGALYGYRGEKSFQEAYQTDVVDTTAAGDTFTGFFLAAFIDNRPVPDALRLAAKAAAISVSRHGAAPSIPKMYEVERD